MTQPLEYGSEVGALDLDPHRSVWLIAHAAGETQSLGLFERRPPESDALNASADDDDLASHSPILSQPRLRCETVGMIPFVLTEPIETDRLTLRLMTLRDVDAVHAYQSLEEVARYQLFEPRDRSAVASKVAAWSQATTLEHDDDFLQLAVVRRSDDQLVGDLYFTLKSVENSTAELGWSFNPEFTGHGYATEGARALMGVAFHTMQLHRVIAELDPRNERSVNLCLRLGMRHEAHFVEDMMFKGQWADTGVYALLAREWRERNAA